MEQTLDKQFNHTPKSYFSTNKTNKTMSANAYTFHSDIAESFDALYNTSPSFKERFAVWTNLLDRYIPNNARVLDLGCGSGIFGFYLAPKVLDVIGVDGSDKMIDMAEAKKKQSGISNVRFLQAEIPLSPAVETGMLDAIISSSVLEYVLPLDETLQDCSRRLVSGGYLIVSMPNWKCWYRKLEKIIFALSGKPAYYRFVQHVVHPDQFNRKVESLGFQCIETQFYAKTSFLGKLLPASAASNLFVSVYKKS